MNAVSLINYHFVWIPKRRKKVLVGAIAETLQQIICDVCNEHRALNYCNGNNAHHVHLFLNAKPTDCPSTIMNRIKGRASHHLRKEFPQALKLPTMWTQALLY